MSMDCWECGSSPCRCAELDAEAWRVVRWTTILVGPMVIWPSGGWILAAALLAGLIAVGGTLALKDWALAGTCPRAEVPERAIRWCVEADLGEWDPAQDTIDAIDRELGAEQPKRPRQHDSTYCRWNGHTPIHAVGSYDAYCAVCGLVDSRQPPQPMFSRPPDRA